MQKVIFYIVIGIIVSLYYFPFQFIALPGINTKMILAVLGGGFLVYNMVTSRSKGYVSKDFMVVSMYAIIVSLIALVAAVVNNTPDYTYASYIVSMWVWLAAAYAVCEIVRNLHGKITMELIINYLTAVCVCQCIIALLIDSIPAVKAVVDTYIQNGQDFLSRSDVDRLYGIGASLDVAGIRFSIVLILIVHAILCFAKEHNSGVLLLYIISYFIVSVVGNMIARTTSVGMLLSLAYLLIFISISPSNSLPRAKLLKCIAGVTLLVIPLITYMFNKSSDFAEQFRFGFEGFFSIVEEKRWDVGTTNQLMDMIVFPSTIHTWIIGDGYMVNPKDIDPLYVGEITGGFYKGTDIGYLRFIFYFGLLGLGAFVLYFFNLTRICNRRLYVHKPLFNIIFLLGLLVWLKVSTDIFLIYALFLLIDEPDADPILLGSNG